MSEMPEWKVFYRDGLDHDRISPSVPSKEAASSRQEISIETGVRKYTRSKDPQATSSPRMT